MPNMAQISSMDIVKMIKIFRKTNQVCCFMGGPGTGKTASTMHAGSIIAADENDSLVLNPTIKDWQTPGNFCVSTVLLSQMDELDTKGLPSKEKDGDGNWITVFTPTELFPTKGKGIIFLDEFPNGNSRVQTAMQEILLEHKSGSHKISKDIQFVVAGNRPGDNCGTFFIPSALRNRMGWFEVSAPRLEEWIGLMSNLGKPIDQRILGFLLSIGTKHIDNFDPKKDHYAYATRRSWEKASDIIQGVTDNKLLKMLVSSWVGAGAGIELASFLELSQKVNVDALLNNPREINKYQADIGTLYSICVALIDKSKDMKTSEKVFNVMMELKADEYGLFIIQGMMREYGPDGVTKRVRNAPKVGPQLMNKYVNLIKQKE